VLGAIIMLSAIGETLNIMTLGGLALAVGILVDDATVTIENINYHLEQGKPVEQSILDGANQIVTPAFVSLLCICIVFVPMFFLQGVARFLFVPMAEAVMFAMIWSFILSRTLVPTMAKYLLQPHVHHEGDRRRRAIRWCRFQRASRRGSSGFAPPTTICCRWRWGGGRCSSPASSRRRAVVPAGAVSRPQLLPRVDAGNILMHVRTQVGTRVEETANQLADVQKAIRKIIPPGEIETLADNIGMPISGINMTYNNTGVIGPAGRRHPDQAPGRVTGRPTNTSRPCASNCRGCFPA
jgi:multidrug efflux pump subunit AcrB